MLDANNAWSDLPTAHALHGALRALRPVLDRGAVQPGRHREPRAPGRSARRSRSPPARSATAAGITRSCSTRARPQILQTDAAVCGGITEWRRIAATAASYGVTVCPHWFHDLHVHLVAATPNARFVEFFPDDQVLNFPPAHRHAVGNPPMGTSSCRRRPASGSASRRTRSRTMRWIGRSRGLRLVADVAANSQ